MSLRIEPTIPPLHIDETNTVRIGATRVTLDTVVGAFLDGASPEAIGASYPTVPLPDIYATISYYLRHKSEVDAYLLDREREADALRQQIESRPDYKLWRERLLARAEAAGIRR